MLNAMESRQEKIHLHYMCRIPLKRVQGGGGGGENCCTFLYCRLSLFLKDLFLPDNLEVATAVVVPRGVGKILPVHRYSVIFFHILVHQEY